MAHRMPALTAQQKAHVRKVGRELLDAYERGEADDLSEDTVYGVVEAFPDRHEYVYLVRRGISTRVALHPGRRAVGAKRKAGRKTATRKRVSSKKTANPSKKKRAPARRKNPDEGFEFVSLDGNMSPATQAKLRRLVKERAPLSYPIGAWSNSEDGKVLRRRKVRATGHDSSGRDRYVITRTRLPGLLIAMVRSGREDEYSLASGILSTLDVELV